MFAQKTIPSTLGEQSGLREMCCKHQKFAHLIKENRYIMRFFAILGKKQGLLLGSPFGRGDTELN